MALSFAYRPRRRGIVGARYEDFDENRPQSSGVGLGQVGPDPNLAFTLREEAAQRERAKLDAQLAQEQMRQAGETGRNADKLVAGNVEQQNDLQFKGWNAHQQRLGDFARQMNEYGFRGQQSALERAQAEKMAILSDELQRGRMGLANEYDTAGREAQYGQQEYMARLGNEFQTERDLAEEQRRRDFFDYQSQRYETKADEQYAQQQYMAQLNHANKLIESGRATRPPGWDTQMLRWQAALGDLDERADLSPAQKEQSRKDLHGKMSRALLNIVPQAPGQWGKPMDEAVQEQVYWDGGEWGKGTPWVRDPKSGQPVIPRGWKPESNADAKGPTRKDVLDHAVKLWNTFDKGMDRDGNPTNTRVFKTIDDAVRQAEIDYGISTREDASSAIEDAARQAAQLPVQEVGPTSPWPRQAGGGEVDPQALVDEAVAIDQEQARMAAVGDQPTIEEAARMAGQLPVRSSGMSSPWPRQASSSDQSQHPKVTSQSEYDRLPSGTIYLDGPTGKLKRKK